MEQRSVSLSSGIGADVLSRVAFVVDDALCGRELGADAHAVVRAGRGPYAFTTGLQCIQMAEPVEHRSRLVGWQCGYEPLFVAVHSYLDVRIDDDEAEELARDYLAEIGWFGDDGPRPADFIF